MKVALILPAEGPQWRSVRVPNLGNEMICEATRRILRRLPKHLEVEEFTFLKRPSPEELQRINRCDCAMFVGTNIFQPHVVGWEWQTEDLKQVTVPYVLYGVGYSGPLQENLQEICQETIELINWSCGAKAIGVRDPQTVRWLKEFGVQSELIGCPVLAYADAFSHIAAGEGKPVLAVRQILLHGPGKETEEAQRAMIDWFFKEYPEGICVVQEPADISLLEGKPVVTDFYDIVQVLSQAQFVLSARLHAGMIALSFGRPVVFLAHDTRVASFCEMIGLPWRKLSFNGLEEATRAIQTIKGGDLSEFKSAVVNIPLFREKLERFLNHYVLEGEESLLLQRKGEVLKQLQSDFIRLQQELMRLKKQLQQRDEEFRYIISRETQQFKKQLQQRDQELANLQQELGEIHSSLAWQLLGRYRQWVNWLLPPGTRRRSWYNRLLQAMRIVLNEGWRALGRRLKAKLLLRTSPPQVLKKELPPNADAKCNQIKLLILVPAMNAGGMERCTEVLLRHFDRKTLKLDLVMIFDRKPFYPVPNDVTTYILERYPQPQQIETRSGELPPPIVARYYDDLVWLEVTARKLGILSQTLQPDVILAQDFFATLLALLAKKYIPSHVKVLGSAHIQYSGFAQIIEKGDLYAALIRRYFNEADRIIAVSQGIASDLIENFGLHAGIVTVIHNPIDLTQINSLAQEPIREHPWLGEGIPIFLFVGRLTPQKGLVYLLQAMALVRQRKKVCCVIIGEGDQRSELEKLAHKLQISEDVAFLGQQSNPFKFMRYATAFVLPSVVEGMPYVILEAMACGCPVIATDCVPGVRELLAGGQRGLLVPPRDPVALAEAMLKTLWDDKLREQFSQSGLEFVQLFSAEKVTAEYEAIILKAIERR